MKINKIFLGLAFAVTVLFTACDVDNVGTQYKPEGQGIAFANSSLGSVEVTLANPVYNIPITRGNAHGAFTGKVDNIIAVVDKDTVDYKTVCSVSDFSFADGSYEAEIAVNVEPLPMGKVLNLTLEYNDTPNLSPTYREGTNVVNVSINKAYTWVSAGTCTFTDYTYNEDGASAQNVPVEHAEATNLYRVIKPWIAVYGEGGDGFTTDTGFQFTLNADNSIDLVAPGNIVAVTDQYSFYWSKEYEGSYCKKEQLGNIYYFEMLGLSGSSLYTGFAFKFTWNK